MNIYEFLGGDTLKIIGRFRSFDEVLVDPTNIKIKIYNSRFELIDTVEGPSIIKESVGVYYTEYVLPDTTRDVDLIFEWYGIINAKPSIDRVRVLVKFV